MSPAGVRTQNYCWRDPAAIYPTDRQMVHDILIMKIGKMSKMWQLSIASTWTEDPYKHQESRASPLKFRLTIAQISRAVEIFSIYYHYYYYFFFFLLFFVIHLFFLF
jgi:hypothetical protein